MLCPKCRIDQAHRSHRKGPLEFLASFLGVYPYRCGPCAYRFMRFRYAPLLKGAGRAHPTEREIQITRKTIRWKRRRREILLYGFGLILFLAFLYFISRERGSPSDNG